MKGQFSAAVRIFGFVLVTLPLMPLQALLMVLWPNMARTLPHYYHRLLCGILGFTPLVSGQLPRGGQCLIVSNHVSWIDIIVLSAVSPLTFVAKREVAEWPLFGVLAKLQGCIFVDRERRHSTKDSGTELEMRLAKGERIVLFPEGTSHDGVKVLPFKSSFFAAAVAPNIAIVPVTLVYKYNYGLPLNRRNRNKFAWYADMDMVPHLWEALCAGPLTVEVLIHPALDVETGLNRKRASELTHRLISRSLATALHGGRILE